MANNENYPEIALGTWSWGTGAAGDDQVFGNNISAKSSDWMKFQEKWT